MSPSLSAFPPELLEATLDLLPWKDVLRSQEVCRLFRDVVRGSPRLMYLIDLALACYVDHGLASRSDTMARRTILAHARRVWNDLSSFAPLQQLTMTDLSYWPIRDGIIMRTSPHDNDMKTFDVDVVSTRPGSPTTSWQVRLPTMENGILCMDADQDLLVVRGASSAPTDPAWYGVAILSFRTGEPHPRAATSSLSFRLSQRVMSMPHYTRFQIFGEVVCISLAGGSQGFTEAVFLNWVSGKQIARFCPPRAERRAWGVPAILLSSTCFLLSSFSLPDRMPSIEVHLLPRERADGSAHTVHIASYCLPRLREREVRVMLTPTAPEHAWAERVEDGFLETSSDGHMLHVSFTRAEGGAFEDPVFFTPLAPFLREAETYQPLDLTSRANFSPRIVPWERWGHTTRWIEVITTEPTWMHGMRRNLKGVGSRYAFPRYIVDFAPLELARAVHERKQADEDITEFDLDGYTVHCGIPQFANIAGSALFADAIRSALPYREKMIPEPSGYSPDSDLHFIGDKVVTLEGGMDDQVRIYAPVCCPR